MQPEPAAKKSPRPEISALDPAFQQRIADWIETHGEVYVVLRYSAAAGNKDYYLIQSAADFRRITLKLPADTSVIVMLEPQLPLRGTVDASFVEHAVQALPDGQWWFLLPNPTAHHSHSEVGETHQELRAALEEYRAQPVALGLEPNWVPDIPEIVEALYPREDGTLKRGVY